MHLNSEKHLAKPDGYFTCIFLPQKYSCQIAKGIPKKKKLQYAHSKSALQKLQKIFKKTKTTLTVTLYLKIKRNKYF